MVQNPQNYCANKGQFFLAGQLHAIEQFASAAKLSPTSPFNQTVNTLIKDMEQVIALPSGQSPSSALLSSLSSNAAALDSLSPSLTLTQSQFYTAMGSIISNISQNLNSAVTAGANSFSQLIGQTILLFNIDVFEGPPDSSGYRPITEPNLNNLLDYIPAMESALNSGNQSFVQTVQDSIQIALANLEQEYPS